MRIVWLCNIALPAFARAMGLPYSEREGWLTGCYERIRQAREINDATVPELAVVFPAPAGLDLQSKTSEAKGLPNVYAATIGGVKFYAFPEDLQHPEHYDASLEPLFAGILADFRPDIVHIFGTEFPHTLAMTRAFANPARTLISIQGVLASIAENYMADLPARVVKRVTFRDFLKKDSLRQQYEKFLQRAAFEKEALARAGHLAGRTAYDRAETAKLAPYAEYHHLNETLRPSFYGVSWDPDKAEPHSIFLSQGDYPLKGFHYMLQAMPAILKKYPDTKLYVSGISIIGDVGGRAAARKKYPRPLWITSYGMYLMSLIRKHHLQDHVVMLGTLNAEAMREQFLRSGVFVCPSKVENSPNSLGEAMLLGLPCVGAQTGGIPSLMDHEAEGLLFADGDAAALAAAVLRLFDDPAAAAELGLRAAARAAQTHDPEQNYRRLLEIYREIG